MSCREVDDLTVCIDVDAARRHSPPYRYHFRCEPALHLPSPFYRMGEAMRILTDCSFLTNKQIRKIEERYGATYVFESQLKLRSEKWSDFSSAVFYTDDPHPEGSNWFAIWDNDGRFMISNAISAVEEPFFGALAENGDVIYSRHCRDFRESDDKTVFVDGGRDRLRHDLIHEVLKLKVLRDRVVVVPREHRRPGCEVPFTAELDWDINQPEFSYSGDPLPVGALSK